MQKLLLLFITCLPFCMQAQSSAVQINNNVINQMKFNEFYLRQVKTNADGNTNVYFDVEKRLGFVGKTDRSLPFYRNVKGIAIITLDQQKKKTKEQFVFISPKKMENSSYDVFVGPSDDMNIIASTNDFIKASTVTEVIPDLAEEMPAYAKEYYENSLIKKTFWGKTTGLQSNKYSFTEMKNGEPAYTEDKKEHPVSIFKPSEEKNFLIVANQKTNLNDEVRGYVFAPHLQVRDKDPRIGEMEKTMITFGPDGKIVNQFEMNTKVSTEITIDAGITDMMDGRESVLGGVILLESKKKKKKKATKKRPNPASVNGKDFYKYDENGKLIKDLHFEVDRENFVYFKEYWETNGQDRFMAVGYKPTEFMYYHVDENGFKKVGTWGLKSKLMQAGKYEEELFKNYEFKLGERTQLKDGKEVVMIEFRGRKQDPRKSEMDFIYVSKGIYILVLNEDGTLLSEHLLNRDLVEEAAINTEIYFMNETANGVEWMMVDESGSLSKKELFNIEKITLSFDKPIVERTIFMENKDSVDWISSDSDFWIIGKTVKNMDGEIIKKAELKSWE